MSPALQAAQAAFEQRHQRGLRRRLAPNKSRAWLWLAVAVVVAMGIAGMR